MGRRNVPKGADRGSPLVPALGEALKAKRPRHFAGVVMPYSWLFGLAALGGVPRNARNIRAADANIGKLSVAQARQFVQTAVIALPLLDEANECGKHSVLLSVRSGVCRSLICN